MELHLWQFGLFVHLNIYGYLLFCYILNKVQVQVVWLKTVLRMVDSFAFVESQDLKKFSL